MAIFESFDQRDLNAQDIGPLETKTTFTCIRTFLKTHLFYTYKTDLRPHEERFRSKHCKSANIVKTL